MILMQMVPKHTVINTVQFNHYTGKLEKIMWTLEEYCSLSGGRAGIRTMTMKLDKKETFASSHKHHTHTPMYVSCTVKRRECQVPGSWGDEGLINNVACLE